jgi:hypothetical protein
MSDRELRAKERELALRKEIYLAAAEAISAGIRAIGSVADMNLSNDEVYRGYLEKAPAIAKVHIIGGEETLRAVAEISSELTSAFLELTAKRMPLVSMKQHIAVLEQQIASFGKERDRMLELMRDHNIEGNGDTRRFTVLQRNFESQQNQIKQYVQEQQKLNLTLYSAQLNLAEGCLTLSSKLAKLAVAAVVSVRRELELPIEQAMYVQLTDELRTKQQTDASRFFADVRGQLEKAAVAIRNDAIRNAAPASGS